MRFRTWLLTGTSLGLLALAPLPAQAQSAELTAAYQAYVDAQNSGDAAAAEAALGAFTEQCIVAGFSSIDECVAALSGGAPAEEPVAEEETAPVEEPVAEEPMIEEQPVEEAPEVMEEEPVQEQSFEEAPAQEEVVEEPAAEESPAEEPAAEEQPAEEQPVEEQPVEEAAPQDDGAAQEQFIADLNAALSDYQQALDIASQGGDFAQAQAIADDAEARILQLCTDNGYPDIVSCIGQELPALPQPAAEEQPATVEDQGNEEPAVDEQPTEEQSTESEEIPADADPLDVPPPPPVDPMVEVETNLATAIELYNSGIEQLANGNADGQVTVDLALQQIADACETAGQEDIAACLEQFGFAPLAEVPQVEAIEEPTEPVELSPAIDEEVTPEAVEALPVDIAPEQAAPLLDSAKQASTEGEQPEDQPAPQPEEPAGPPPESDAEAQARIEPVEVQSVVAEEGEQIAAQAIALAPAPAEEPLPQNVTIINNTTVNNTVINNNAPSSPVIFQIGVNIVINNPEQERDRMYRPDEDRIFYEELRNGRTRETIVRPNGVRIVTIRNRWGDVLKRSRFTPDGREFVLAYYDEDQFEDRDDDREGFFIDPGRELPPLRLNIPAREYILDVEYADEEEVELFFRKPPVEQVRRIYSIEEVKRSARIRDSVPRIEVGGLTFDSGKATISANQVGTLSKVAKAMLDILDENPAETFLIEGHTDAVGSDTSNLVLSDQRAAVVAQILADFYKVPPENLVTQGYGERFLKVNTQEAERLNRRVTIKRITPLITVSQR